MLEKEREVFVTSSEKYLVKLEFSLSDVDRPDSARKRGRLNVGVRMVVVDNYTDGSSPASRLIHWRCGARR